VFENRVLRKVFGLWGTGEWRRLHNDELYDPYSSTDSIWVIKSSRMGRECGLSAQQVRCMAFGGET
jgi:hypothetical protein